MDDSTEILLNLIRISINSDFQGNFHDFKDSKSLVRLACHQEVASFVYDAVNKLHQKGIDILHDQEAKLMLLHQMLQQEKNITEISK